MDSDRARLLVSSGYAVGFLMIAMPLVELALTVWPWAPGTSGWRVGFFGMATRGALMPFLGLAVTIATALALGQPRVARILSVLGAAVGTFFLAGLALFALDLVELRTIVREEAIQAFDVTAVRAAITAVLHSVAAFWLSVGVFRYTRRRRTDPEKVDAPGPASRVVWNPSP